MPWQNAEPKSVGFNHTDANAQNLLTATQGTPINSVRLNNTTGAEVTCTVAVSRSATVYPWFSVDVPAGGVAIETGPDSIQSGDILQVTAANGVTTWVSYLESV